MFVDFKVNDFANEMFSDLPVVKCEFEIIHRSL